MKLEVGKSYKDEEGNRITITNYSEIRGYVGMNYATGRTKWYNEFGENDTEAKGGLVSEWVNEPIKLEIGKSYRTAKGNRIDITDVDNKGQYRVWNGTHHYDIFNDEIISEWIDEIPKPPLSLEIGKSYWNTEGEKVTILQRDHKEFIGIDEHSVNVCNYNEYGKNMTCDTGDLASEWVERGGTLDIVVEPPLSLEVGKIYLDEVGKKRLIEKEEGGRFFTRNRKGVFKGMYASNGFAISDGFKNLVSEWVDPNKREEPVRVQSVGRAPLSLSEKLGLRIAMVSNYGKSGHNRISDEQYAECWRKLYGSEPEKFNRLKQIAMEIAYATSDDKTVLEIKKFLESQGQ